MTLKEIRKAAKVTIKDTGLSPRIVSKIENNQTNVTVKALEKYLTAIGMKLTYSI